MDWTSRPASVTRRSSPVAAVVEVAVVEVALVEVARRRIVAGVVAAAVVEQADAAVAAAAITGRDAAAPDIVEAGLAGEVAAGALPPLQGDGALPPPRRIVGGVGAALLCRPS